MDCKLFQEVVSDDIRRVDRCIGEQLVSGVKLINEVGQYIIQAGGKRLRPLLVLLAARVCKYQGEGHIPLAVVIEFLHTATLLHDDVVDKSDRRRGRKTVNILWGNNASVLVGDFLYSRAFQLMNSFENSDILQVLADATVEISEGEVMQLMNVRRMDVTEEEYMNVVRCKTGVLFQASSRTAAILSGVSSVVRRHLSEYGYYLGMAFQLIDDALDYDGDAVELGKNIGGDLKEGKLTLPLIFVLREGKECEAKLVRDVVLNGEKNKVLEVIQIVKICGALEYTYKKAEVYFNKAMNCLEFLPSNKYSDAMAHLAHFVVSRRW